MGARRGKSGFHSEGRQVSRRRGRASKQNLLRRKRVSRSKSSLGRSADSWFHPSLATPETEKKVGRRRALS